MFQTGKQQYESSQRAPAVPDRSVAALADFDTQLILQARAGDRDAANAFVRRNFPRISRYLARLIGPRRPVEDLAQDVFLQALSHVSDYRPQAKVLTWLYRIATNTALNYLKQPALRRNVAQADERAAELVDRHEPSPDRQLSLDELRQRVSVAVNDLPTNQRIALTLFEYEDCSYEQVAAVLDVSVEAVRSLLMRARTTLRAQLRDLR